MAKWRATILATVCMLAVATPAAVASPASSVISDCNAHGRLTQHYSVTQLHGALSAMPADVAEYTDCVDVIQRALLAQVSSLHGSSSRSDPSSSGSVIPTALIVVLAVIVIAGGTVGGLAIRRRR